MKKILFFTAVAALSAMVSCQKEEAPSQKEAKPIVFSASIAAPSDTKVSVNTYNGKVSWVKDDEITITDGTNTGVYKADNAGETTTFTYVSGYEFTAVETATEYEATYGTQPAIGVDQTYSDTPGKLIYMTSEADVQSWSSVTAVNFTFTAQCGLLKLTLDKDKTEGIKRIYVIDGSGNAYKLLCETAKTIQGGRDFYIALPAGKYTKYIIRDNEGYEAVKTAKIGNETSIAANQINKVTFSSLTFNTPIYPESNTVGTKVADYWWAPVNCGYEPATTSPEYKGYPYGKLYQWGRKDGQGYDSNDATSPTNENGNLVESQTASPEASKFYYGSYNWYNVISADALWGASKTSYDPCPTGWRVPTYTELEALFGDNENPSLVEVGGQNGCYFNGEETTSGGVFLPAAGCRYYDDGNAYFRGDNGYYWSSFSGDVDAGNLCFNSDGAGIDGNYCAFGYSVRCVQE